MNSKKIFSRCGLGLAVYLAVGLVFSFVCSRAAYHFIPQISQQPWFIWLSSSIATYGVGFLVLFLFLRTIPKQSLYQKSLSGGLFAQYGCMMMFLIFLGTLIGTNLNEIIYSFTGKTSTNDYQIEILMQSNFLVIFLFVCVIAPVMEELMLRKILIDRIIIFGDKAAILFSGLCFGLIHTNLSQFSYGFLAGCFLAYIYIRTGRIRYSIWLHMIVNFLGSFVPALLERVFNITDVVSQLQNSSGVPDLSGLTSNERLGMMVYSIYSFILILVYFAGIVFFFLRRRKAELRPGERSMRFGQMARTMFGNFGMIAFLIVVIAISVINAILG